MKNLYSLLTVIAFMLVVPFAVFAAVDISLTDTSTEDSNTITIDIDTQTDVLDKVSLPIRFSEGITILELTAGDIECSTLEYGEDEEINNEIVIRCLLQESTALDGVLVNISFTSTEDIYTFELLENDNLDIGTLVLGETINIGEVTDEEISDIDEEGIPFEDLGFPITQDGLAAETEEGFSIEDITEYLPYILIGGSVILLISIIAILLSKKKDSKDSEPINIPTKRTSPQPPVQDTKLKEEPSLRSMVNEVSNTKSLPQEDPQPEINAQPDSPFTTTQPTPSIQTPPVPPVPPAQPTSQQPPVQKTNTPEISPSAQEEDLQEILKRESSRTQEQQTTQSTTPETPIEPQIQAHPPTQRVPVSGNLNPANTQTLNSVPQNQPQNVQTSPEYPSVPASALQPTPPPQVPPVVETPEELPDVPPTM